MVITAIQSADLCAMTHLLKSNLDPVVRTFEEIMALSTIANAVDYPTCDQEMNGSDATGYLEACKKELDMLEKKTESWEVTRKEPGMKVLRRTWAFQYKQYLDGAAQTLKVRYSSWRDKKVQGINCFDTFTSIVNWTTVHVMMILIIILNLATFPK